MRVRMIVKGKSNQNKLVEVWLQIFKTFILRKYSKSGFILQIISPVIEVRLLGKTVRGKRAA